MQQVLNNGAQSLIQIAEAWNLARLGAAAAAFHTCKRNFIGMEQKAMP